MAERGIFSQSFLRETGLIGISEIENDEEGNNVVNQKILQGILSKDPDGKLIRNKANISKIFNKYNVKYRMVFNAMNMSSYTYDEVNEAVHHMADYINEIGVFGIVEFHAADKTQNSDHMHFWINSEDAGVYQKIAREMVSQQYSNIEDVYIQKYESNDIILEEDYVNVEDMSLSERFDSPSIGRETGEYLESLNELLVDVEDADNIEVKKGVIKSIVESYSDTLDRIKELLSKDTKKEVPSTKESDSYNDTLEDNEDTSFWDKFKDEAHTSFDNNLRSFRNSKYKVVRECTLQDNKAYSILSRIEELKNKLTRK